jgi:hypothetical protein
LRCEALALVSPSDRAPGSTAMQTVGDKQTFWQRLMGRRAAEADVSVPEAGPDERRIWVRFPSQVETTLQPAQDGRSERLPATIRDISRGGIRLVVETEFEPGALVSVELPGPGGDASYAVLAYVVHASQTDDGAWTLGCTFARELSDEDLEAFGGRRKKPTAPDDRSWVRFPCHVQSSYHIVAEPDGRLRPAQVLNISASGIGLLVEQAVETGALLSLELWNATGDAFQAILACVVHATPQGEGHWALGCNFIRELTVAELQALL